MNEDELTNLALAVSRLSSKIDQQTIAQKSTENMDEWYLAFESWFENQYRDIDTDERLIYWDSNEQTWFKYDPAGIFKPYNDEEIISIIKRWADDAGIKTTQSRFAHGITRLKSMVQFKHEWDAPTFINFKNGIYVLKSKTLEAHSPQYYSRSQLGVNYIIGPFYTPCWDKVRATYPIQLAHFESFMLSAIIQDYSNEGLYFGVGKTGSGKGTIAQMYQLVFGNGIANVQFENLDNDKFGLVPLLGKRICLNREMTICTLNSRVISFLKDVVTHEGPIDVNMKNKNRFPYLFNIWFVGFTNQLPFLSEGTDRTAWFRRTIIDVYDITQVKDVEFKKNICLEADSIVSRLLQTDYVPIIHSGTDIDAMIERNAELWDYWSDPIKRIILANFEKSLDPNDRLDVHTVWDIIDQALKTEKHIIKYERVQSYTTMYLDRIGIRKINRKVYGPIKAIKPEIVQQILDDKQTAEAEFDDKFTANKIRYSEP